MPELIRKEDLWHEIRKKVGKNYALESIDAARHKLNQAILHIEHNHHLVKYMSSADCDAEVASLIAI